MVAELRGIRPALTTPFTDDEAKEVWSRIWPVCPLVEPSDEFFEELRGALRHAGI